METRQILQGVLALIIISVVGMGSFIAYSFTRKGETIVVKEVIEDKPQEEEKNPWEAQGHVAIELVQNLRVKAPAKFEALPDAKEEEKKKKKKDDDEPEEVETSVKQLVEREDFIKHVLSLDNHKPLGWKVQWWGELKQGESFYLVRYAFEDAHITVGPSWLVDLKGGKVVPKNVLARVVMQPVTRIKNDEYYDKHQQVVSALASHRFESALTLGGALLMHFENREESAEGDAILGWTIEHDRGDLFKAYFQWVEAGEPTYAEFEFDYQRKALKASNLQAADVMRIGEDFEKTERADIMPGSYDAKESNESKRWQGPARKACKSRKNRDRCKSMATMFEQREIVEALEWLLTAKSESPDAFKLCKENRKCAWSSKPKEGADGTYLVSYIYNLDGSEEKRVGWEVAVKDAKIKPVDRLSTAAWRAINPRGE